jgi:hypothetical protein
MECVVIECVGFGSPPVSQLVECVKREGVIISRGDD